MSLVKYEIVDFNQLRRSRNALVRALAIARCTVDGDTVRCGFHGDGRPSAAIFQTSDGAFLFHCFRCDWNEQHQTPKATGDVMDVVRQATGIRRRQDAGVWIQRRLGRADLTATPSSGSARPAQRQPDPGMLATARSWLRAGQERLRSDQNARRQLWITRAIDYVTAKSHGIGVTESCGPRWMLPIHRQNGNLVGVKLHAASGQRPKALWYPPGVGSKFVYPACLDHGDPVWLAAGELKALAVVSLGRSAMGVTCGEAGNLPECAVGMLAGHEVALVADNDDTGRAWAKRVLAQLTRAGVPCTIVDLRFGTPKEDIGDWAAEQRIRRRLDAHTVGQLLDAAYHQAAGGA